MKDERYKEIMKQFGMPDSQSLLSILKQVANETAQELKKPTREVLAAHAHFMWSGWMRYLFSKSDANESGTMTIPVWAVNRWKRQADTDYADLPEIEKESDREEADGILKL